MSAIQALLQPGMCVHITILFEGNAADHRGAWDATTLSEGFQVRPGETLRITQYANGVRLHALETNMPQMVASYVTHVRKRLYDGLNGYRAFIHTLLAHDPFYNDPGVYYYTLSVRVFYGPRGEYKIMISAPPEVNGQLSSYDFLMDTMQTMENWDVNSINAYGFVRNGMYLTSREEDAENLAKLFRCVIMDEMRSHYRGCLDVSFRQYRRGNIFFLQFGVTTTAGTTWGKSPNCVPLKPGYITIDRVDDVCAICLNNMSENLVKTDCGHVYHLKCMNTLWEHSVGSIKCPMCRNELTSIHRARPLVKYIARRPSTRSQSETISDRVQKRRRRATK